MAGFFDAFNTAYTPRYESLSAGMMAPNSAPPQSNIGFFDPNNAGTMALIGSLLQASGPQKMSQSLPQIAGQALGAYGQGRAAQQERELDNYTKTALLKLKEREFNEISASDTAKLALEEKKIDTLNKRLGAGGGAGGTALLREMAAFGIDPLTATPEQLAYFHSARRGGLVPSGYVVNKDGQTVRIAGAKEGSQEAEAYKSFGKEEGKRASKIQGEVASLNEGDVYINSMTSALDKLESTGPIQGRIQDLTKDPKYTEFVSAKNSLTLYAKNLLGMPGANFSDADRDFLEAVAGGTYGRIEGYRAVAGRLSSIQGQLKDIKKNEVAEIFKAKNQVTPTTDKSTGGRKASAADFFR